MKTTFPDPADVLNFTLTIIPDEGALRRSERSSHQLNRANQALIS
jgi:hypothetical protein